ncbi:unnamed protein product, partial [Prorocentrum cordatum]
MGPADPVGHLAKLRGAPEPAAGGPRLRTWEPLAQDVALVLRRGSGGGLEAHSMARAADSGVWEATVPCPRNADYAFLATWTQELRCKEGQEVALFGLPHAEADVPLWPAPGEAAQPAIVPPAAWPRTPPPEPLAGALACEGADPQLEDGQFRRQISAEERLGRAEFLLEVSELSLVSADAEGVRFHFYAAARVAVDRVQVSAVDGSWGPYVLQPAPGEAGEPVVWVADAPEWLCPLSASEVVVQESSPNDPRPL